MSITYQDLDYLQNPYEVKTFNDYKTLDDDYDSRFMFDQQSLSGGKRGRQEADLWRVSLPLYP